MADDTNKRNNGKGNDLDQKDFEILAAFESTPRATYRSVGALVGLSASAVLRRVHRWPEKEQVRIGRAKLRTLADKVFRSYQRGIARDDKSARRELAFGLGLLSYKQTIETTELPVTEDDVVRVMKGMDVGSIDRIIAALERDESGEIESDSGSDTQEPDDADGGVVARE